jgi:polyhydroxybutyrate depolymerase
MESTTGMSTLAERDGVIVVYPSKADGAGVWQSAPGSSDVAFIGDLVTYLHDHGCGSPSNTTVLGYSAGAMLTSQVACERPEGIAAVMMVAGVLPPELPCDTPKDLAVWALHGTADPVVRFDGEVSPYVAEVTEREGYTTTRAEMMRQWSLVKGCDAPADNVANDQLVITRYECPGVAPTTLLTFIGGNHDWRMLGNWDTSRFLWSQLPTG